MCSPAPSLHWGNRVEWGLKEHVDYLDATVDCKHGREGEGGVSDNRLRHAGIGTFRRARTWGSTGRSWYSCKMFR